MTWSRTDALTTGLPVREQYPGGPEFGLAAVEGRFVRTDLPGPAFGMVAVAGDVVVTATVAAGIPGTTVLRFINARTGALIAARSLRVQGPVGLRTDATDAGPVVEVKYAATAAEHDDGPATYSDIAFDASGRRVWGAGAQPTAAYATGGLIYDPAGGFISGGHTLRLNPGTDALNHGGSHSVQDLNGKTLLTVPYWAWFNPRNPAEGSLNGIQLAGRYAVVIHGGNGKTPAAPPHTRFTVYDFSRGTRVVAAPTVTFPEGANQAHRSAYNPNPQPSVVTACGTKIVLALADPSYTGPSKLRLTVLDAATGRTTPPADVPLASNGSWVGPLSGLADQACSTMLVTGDMPAPTSIAISLSSGKMLWQQPTLNVTYHYLSIHDGVIYALRCPAPQAPALLIAISAATGRTLGSGFTAVPLAFTADGTPVFASVPHDPAPRPSPQTSSPGRFLPQPGPPLPASVGVQLWAG